MSVDRSLRIKSSLVRHRNVLTRAERVQTMIEREDWEDERSPLGLPKISHRKGKAGGKKKAKAEGEGEGGEAAAKA